MDQKRNASPNPDSNRKFTKTSAATSASSSRTQLPELPQLPTEIWTSIFDHLSANQLLTLRQVCHCWRNIINSNTPLLAKLTVTFPARLTICSTYKPANLPPAAKVHFKNVTITAIGPWWTPFGQRLTELKLSSYSEVDHASLLAMLKHTPNLKSFELSESKMSGERPSGEVDFRLDKLERLVLCGIEDAAPVEVFRQLCGGLKHLRISWDWFTEEHSVSAQEMGEFLQGLQDSLEELYVTCSEDSLVELMKLDRLKLQKLTLAGDEHTDDEKSKHLLMEFCRMLPSLEYLKIKGIRTFDEQSHSLLCNMGQVLPNLNCLQINGMHVDLAFLHNFPKQLQTFKLSGDSRWDSGSAVEIQFNGDEHLNLKELQLKKIHIEDSCLQRHLPKMPHLRSLTIKWCTSNFWSDLLQPLKSLKLLTTLSLHGINVNESADDWTGLEQDDFAASLARLQLAQCEMPPKLLATVLAGCPGLRELRLQSMKLNDTADEEQVAHVVCRKLSKLNTLIIEGCELSNEEVDFIRENCKSLKEFQITGCW
ncbi:conserved hypothetical protein [Culex quinquefasciatus]|uniref:F-box domain-containing protein n=1 Tax=Culex quinquefasciatus TaxID=7176 RepID=B0WXW8_CULQU|nr:conserved hypothetical protein [Culex quinquefasciatus]|eukprot:XP_001862240.1 conserved hypothetical protein [Culex quinquefasciatus]